jgi:cholesterol transport system auxiliary component
MFEVPPVTVKYPPVKGAVVEVSRFNVSPGSEGKEFIYRTGDVSFESDFYNQFFRPPGAMLTEITIRWLESTGLFQDVLSTVTQAGANYFIEANVVQLYGDYRSSPKAVMEIQFLLLKYTTDSSYNDNTEIVFAKSYKSEIPIASQTPNDLMMGWNTALGEILNAFLEDLKNNVD